MNVNGLNNRSTLSRNTTDYHASDKKPPAILTAIIKKTPRRARDSITEIVAAAPDLPPLLPLVEAGLFVVDGAVGTVIPVADARHELATAAADAEEALLFTVPLPAKLHDCALRLFAS